MIDSQWDSGKGSGGASTRFARATLPDIGRAPGIADIRALPDLEFHQSWDAILVPGDQKDRLLSHALLNFTMRGVVPHAVLPLHGVILLVGPPGTGKTSLAKGLASRVAEMFSDRDFRYLEVDPHALTGSQLGKSQRAVTDLFDKVIREQAAHASLVVLLDEVETLVSDRAKLSLEANPADVHRATDAALVQLDRFAASMPNVLFVATSNFPRAIDAAFVSRSDLVLEVPLPNAEGRLAILRDALSMMGTKYNTMARLAKHSKLMDTARAAEGLDGRAMRKLVAMACALDKKVALDPNELTLEMLRDAALRAAKAAVAVAAAQSPAGRR